MRGAIFTVIAFGAMVILAIVETGAYLSSDFSTSIFMDENPNSQLRVNFNITMHDLSCDYASVDLWDTIGTNRQNVTKNVEKWQLDDNGVRRMYQGRNRDQHEVEHDTHHPELHVLHQNGVHAVPLDKSTYADHVRENEFTFVDFYAPWCIWCQRLEPIWEQFAEDVEGAELPVSVAKVNCVTDGDLCKAQRVMAFPTLRFFKHGTPVNAADYRSDRTTTALMEFVKRKLELESQYKQWPEARKAHATNWNPDHPGCMLVGFLLVNRVPGNFHIEARSKNHNLNAAAANLSHTVNHLSFGSDLTDKQKRTIHKLHGVDLPEHFAPLDGSAYVVDKQHTAFHHYLKVVSTHYKLGSHWSKKMMAYQVLSTNQVLKYTEEEVPEAKVGWCFSLFVCFIVIIRPLISAKIVGALRLAQFHYDISPMAVVVKKEGDRKFYDFITSLLAILGGTFTVISFFEHTWYMAFKKKAD